MGERLWTDLEASKNLVDNINTLFQPSSACKEDEGEEGVAGRKSSGTMTTQSNKPYIPTTGEGEMASTVSAKSDTPPFPLDNIKVEQRLPPSTISIHHYKHSLI